MPRDCLRCLLPLGLNTDINSENWTESVALRGLPLRFTKWKLCDGRRGRPSSAPFCCRLPVPIGGNSMNPVNFYRPGDSFRRRQCDGVLPKPHRQFKCLFLRCLWKTATFLSGCKRLARLPVWGAAGSLLPQPVAGLPEEHSDGSLFVLSTKPL